MGLWTERGNRVAKRLRRQISLTPYSLPVIPRPTELLANKQTVLPEVPGQRSAANSSVRVTQSFFSVVLGFNLGPHKSSTTELHPHPKIPTSLSHSPEWQELRKVPEECKEKRESCKIWTVGWGQVLQNFQLGSGSANSSCNRCLLKRVESIENN